MATDLDNLGVTLWRKGAYDKAKDTPHIDPVRTDAVGGLLGGKSVFRGEGAGAALGIDLDALDRRAGGA